MSYSIMHEKLKTTQSALEKAKSAIVYLREERAQDAIEIAFLRTELMKHHGGKE